MQQTHSGLIILMEPYAFPRFANIPDTLSDKHQQKRGKNCFDKKWLSCQFDMTTRGLVWIFGRFIFFCDV